MRFNLGNSNILYIFDTKNFENYLYYIVFWHISSILIIITITTYMLLFYSAYTVPLDPHVVYYLLFTIHLSFFKTGKTETIHCCRLIIPHIPPTIKANIASLWSTHTKVSALHWYPYYCGLVYHIDIIFRTIQGDYS